MMSVSGHQQYSWRREPIGRSRGVVAPASVSADGTPQATTNSQYGQWFNSDGHAPEIYWNGTVTRAAAGPPGGVTSAARSRAGGRPTNEGSAPSSPAKMTWQQQSTNFASAANGGDVQRRNESTPPEVQSRTSWRHISPQQQMQRSATTLGLPTTGSSKADGVDAPNHSDLLRDYARYRQLQSGIGLLGTAGTSVPGSVPEVHIDGTWRGRVLSRGPNSTSAGNGDMATAQSPPAIYSPMSSNRLLNRQVAFGGANSTSGCNAMSTSSNQPPVSSRPCTGLPTTGSGPESTLIIPLRLGDKTTSGSDVNDQLRQAINNGGMEEPSVPASTFSWTRPQTGYGNTSGSRISSFPLMIGSIPIGDGSENAEIGCSVQGQPRAACQLQGSDTSSRLSYSAPSSDQYGTSSAGSDAYRTTSTAAPAGGGATCMRSVPDTNARPKRSILKKSSSYSSVQSANSGGGEQPPWRIGGGGGGGVRWPPVSGYIRDPYNCGGALYRQRTAPTGFNERERTAPGPTYEPARPTTTSSKRVTFSV